MAKGHGLSGTKLYHIREGMLSRCNNSNNVSYKHYGGRGIKVCREWYDAKKFIDWATANGYKEELRIDRIDNNGNYEPDNCRWTTMKINANNMSSNRRLTLNGKTHTVSEWSKIFGIHFNRIHTRLNRGWTTKRALTTPLGKYTKKGGNH